MPIALAWNQAFSILDRSDAADLIDLVRDDLGLCKTGGRFPKKATCLAIYSYAVNAQLSVGETLDRAFPWCAEWAEPLKGLFARYVETKQAQAVLDYDDLLLYWSQMMQVEEIARLVSARFDHILVDEYQDTNALQASILLGLKPDGVGVTVVGDDAQAIYSFRSATVRNILDFPNRFVPPAEVVSLEQNYRSTQPILEACNRIIARADERFTKNLFTVRPGGRRPLLAMIADETAQVDFVVQRILGNREAGMELRDQVVLFRASHHASQLEVELARRNIPFVKFGGLKFLEAAHVKDVLAVLRWAENPRDHIAGLRVLKLIPGIGPATARRALVAFEREGHDFSTLECFRPPAAAAEMMRGLAGVMQAAGEVKHLGRDRSSGCGCGTIRSSTCSTTIPARAAATSISWSVWRRSIPHGRASSPISRSIRRKRVAVKRASRSRTRTGLSSRRSIRRRARSGGPSSFSTSSMDAFRPIWRPGRRRRSTRSGGCSTSP